MEDLNKMTDEQKLSYIDGLDKKMAIDDEIIKSVLQISNDLIRQKAMMLLEQKVRELGQVRNFQKIVGIIKQELREEECANQNYVTKLDGIDLTLQTGDWICDDKGIRKFSSKNGQLVEEIASWQPIIISAIFFNKELCSYRVQLAFKESEGSKTKTITVSKSMIATSSNITNLADYGIAVTNITAPLLVRYLNDLERLNVLTIPRNNAISRLGWIDNEFMPYNKTISFDGETMYKELFDAIRTKGDYQKWKQMVENEKSLEARIILGTSFASPLVGLLDKLVFFTHFWGTTGVGKSVALYLAESIWGEPKKLVQNLNGTAVALERLASFFCNVPLCLDELQTLKKSTSLSRDTSFDDILYKLGQGRGKSRGRKDGAIDKVSTWALSIITTGEEPIATDNSGGGAKNRVIDVYCRNNIFTNAVNVINCCNDNYGFAGQDFIQKLITYVEVNGKAHLNDIYTLFFNYLMKADPTPTDKQAMSASMIALGYTLMKMFIFSVDEGDAIQEGLSMLDDISPLLVNITQIDNVDNFYTNILSFVVQNKHHFIFTRTINGTAIEYNPLENRIEVWGKITNSEVDISNIVVRKFCADNNTSYTKMLRSLYERQKSICVSSNSDTKFEGTKPVRINDGLVRCLALRLPQDEEKEDILIPIDDDSLPF